MISSNDPSYLQNGSSQLIHPFSLFNLHPVIRSLFSPRRFLKDFLSYFFETYNILGTILLGLLIAPKLYNLKLETVGALRKKITFE